MVVTTATTVREKQEAAVTFIGFDEQIRRDRGARLFQLGSLSHQRRMWDRDEQR